MVLTQYEKAEKDENIILLNEATEYAEVIAVIKSRPENWTEIRPLHFFAAFMKMPLKHAQGV